MPPYICCPVRQSTMPVLHPITESRSVHMMQCSDQSVISAPRTMEPYQTDALLPSFTSPTREALGATKDPCPRLGRLLKRFCSVLCRETVKQQPVNLLCKVHQGQADALWRRRTFFQKGCSALYHAAQPVQGLAGFTHNKPQIISQAQ